MNKALALYCSTMARIVNTKHRAELAKADREAGQGITEYLGLIIIMGAALALGSTFLSLGKGDGPLVSFVQNAIKAGLRSALSKLGITV